ncbi:MAG: hypothetical protein HRU28_00460, partial [Rhizobiales bacterium]|nr:hypothetical protein [Hyphomicrobiales bacterium]
MKFLKILASIIILAIPVQALALGGDAPLSGIDVFFKLEGEALRKIISFTNADMKVVNRFKGIKKAGVVGKVIRVKFNNLQLVTQTTNRIFINP